MAGDYVDFEGDYLMGNGTTGPNPGEKKPHKLECLSWDILSLLQPIAEEMPSQIRDESRHLWIQTWKPTMILLDMNAIGTGLTSVLTALSEWAGFFSSGSPSDA